MRKLRIGWAVLIVAVVAVGAPTVSPAHDTVGPTIRVGVGSVTPNLDFWVNNPVPPRSFFAYGLFSPVAKIVKGPHGQAITAPDVAESWRQVSPTVWRFTVKKGLKFPNGEPEDARAVAFAIGYVVNPKHGEAIGSTMGTVLSAHASSARVLTIKTKDPNALIPRLLSALVVVPPKAFLANGPAAFWANPIGTGPWKLASFQPNQSVTLVPNSSSIEGKPKAGKLVFQAIPDAASRAAALQAHDVDIINTVGTDQLAQLKGAGNKIAATTTPGMYIIDLYAKSGPLANPRVRQAINYAIDQKTLVKQIMGGYGEVSQAQLPGSEISGFCPSVKAYPYDPTKAKSMLAAEGVKPGTTLHFQTSNGYIVNDTLVAQAVADMLGKVGLNVKVDVLDLGRYFSAYATSSQREDMFEYRLAASPQMDALIQYAHFTSYTTIHTTGYANPAFDAAYAKALAIPIESSKRAAAVCSMASILKTDAPEVFGFEPPDIWAYASSVKGFSLDVTDNPYFLSTT
jgi:peptide/nickel transport system substrate-binding protein